MPQSIARTEYSVSMRDGVCLATDVYFPPDHKDASSWPVIMERTPYNKRGESRWEYLNDKSEHPMTREVLARSLASAGYVVVMQDCRGRYRSEGVFTKYINEAWDGYDTLEWLQSQRWCNGAVGTMGMSYGAHTQTSMAALKPPGLRCMIIDSGGFWSAFHEGIRQGGAFELKQVVWAHRHAIRQAEHEGNEARLRELQRHDLWHWFADMPWQRGKSPVAAAPEYEEYMFQQWERSEYSDYWQSPGLAAQEHYAGFPDIPVLVIGSWYDPYVRTSVQHFQNLSSKNSSPIKLIMGPWTHGARVRSYSGDVSYGSTAVFNDRFEESYLDHRINWFDACLKEASDDHADATVDYFLMGGGDGSLDPTGKINHGGDWKSSTHFPPTATERVEFSLTKAGELVESEKAEATGSISFKSDPDDPVPTIGGAITSGEPIMFGGSYEQTERADLLGCKQPGRRLKDRDDVVCFQTPVLSEPIEVVGEIEVHLAVSSDCPDIDIHARLIDVYPEASGAGEVAINIAHGLLRLRYRESWSKPQLMQPNQIYEISFKLTPTANRFKAGNRLRLMLSGSSFPQFDINPNTGDNPGEAHDKRIAVNKIHFGDAHRSRINVPIMRNASQATLNSAQPNDQSRFK